jgi:hypothetical protein
MLSPCGANFLEPAINCAGSHGEIVTEQVERGKLGLEITCRIFAIITMDRFQPEIAEVAVVAISVAQRRQAAPDFSGPRSNSSAKSLMGNYPKRASALSSRSTSPE